jgi:hypothetical protein
MGIADPERRHTSGDHRALTDTQMAAVDILIDSKMMKIIASELLELRLNASYPCRWQSVRRA